MLQWDLLPNWADSACAFIYFYLCLEYCVNEPVTETLLSSSCGLPNQRRNKCFLVTAEVRSGEPHLELKREIVKRLVDCFTEIA